MEIRQVELGSGITICIDCSTSLGKGPSGTSARPEPRVGNRSNKWFTPTKIDSKVWG